MKSSIPNEKILCNDRDPPWMNCYPKIIVLTKRKMHKLFARKKNKHNLLCNTFNKLQTKLNETIENAKQKYLVRISTKKKKKKNSFNK